MSALAQAPLALVEGQARALPLVRPPAPGGGGSAVVRAIQRAGWLAVEVAEILTAAQTPATPTERASELQRRAISLCARHGLFAEIGGRLPDGPAVIVANHLSYVDPLVLAGLLPVAPIAKAEVGRWPMVGAAVRSLGLIPVRRGDAHSGARALLTALRALEGGVCVLNFPEGTTTDGSCMLPFHRGVFGLAQLAGVPIVPVGIALEPAELAWVGDTFFLPHYARTAARESSRVRVRFGAPIAARRHADPAGLAAVARSRIEKLRRSV